MNTEILSLRLQTVVKYIPQGLKIADIGSDHAYLPCHVVSKGISPFAIAGEVVEGPYQSAMKQVKLEGLESKILVRKGDGLAVINPNEVDCITICGMGGTLISTILERGKEKLGTIKRLILQPNVGSKAVRKWLLENGWMLIEEEIIAEDGKVYEVLVAEQGSPLTGYEQDIESGLLLGPYLKKKQNAAFKQKWQAEKENWLRILQQLEQGGMNPEIEQKRQELLQKVKIVEEAFKGNEES
ncbi:tRNA (adenine(22)-N(1))-methyltransferase [Neobacillus sp. LXY-4]|uniref:tRNA (adenine(22)-N(1))-methyltransferase n=1 Tax=Neobacillus sp. LXY-4 TaxID=3379826 RepID=UPI003EE0BB83